MLPFTPMKRALCILIAAAFLQANPAGAIAPYQPKAIGPDQVFVAKKKGKKNYRKKRGRGKKRKGRRAVMVESN